MRLNRYPQHVCRPRLGRRGQKDEKAEAIASAVQAFFDACVELKIGRIAENCPLPQAIDPAQNPRAWWNLHEYRE